MGLRVWDQLNDPYDNTQQADNWARVDYHDHTPGRGTQIPTDGIEDGAITPEKLSTVVTVASFIPVSTVLSYAGPSPLQDVSAVAPDGFVFADGLLYDGTLSIYAALWAVLGTNYGGSGISAFAVPNLCQTLAAGSNGRVPVGVRSGMVLGSTGGATAVTLTGAQSGVNGSGSVVAVGNHTHANEIFVSDDDSTHDGNTVSTASPFTRFSSAGAMNNSAAGGHGHALTNRTADASHENMPPYQVLNYIIKL